MNADVAMPHRDGISATKEILSSFQGARDKTGQPVSPPVVIAVTASVTDNDVAACKESGLLYLFALRRCSFLLHRNAGRDREANISAEHGRHHRPSVRGGARQLQQPTELNSGKLE